MAGILQRRTSSGEIYVTTILQIAPVLWDIYRLPLFWGPLMTHVLPVEQVPAVADASLQDDAEGYAGDAAAAGILLEMR